MTQQDDITQRVLTDDEINAACGRHAADTGWHAENDRKKARAVESALLSKLRAEGVQAGDEAEAFEAWLYLGQTKFEPSDLNEDALSLAQLAYSAGRAAPVASAPADERADAQEYGSPADVAQRIEQYLAHDGRMNSGTQLLYEAMKALRASQGDRNDG